MPLQQDNPAILYNGNNEYLHYEDTWYILDSKPDEYVVIFYIGNNDAWQGYGGATIYSRWAREIMVLQSQQQITGSAACWLKGC